MRGIEPRDARARLLVLTDRGQARTEAAEAAAAATVDFWRAQLGDAEFGRLRAALELIARPGPIRPAW